MGYAEGGPREEVANSGAWRTGSKSGAGASQATRKTGVTVAVTVVCRKGSGPTWHSRQQWSGAWCDSSWEASARDCPQRVRHTSKRISSVLAESRPPPAAWAGLPVRSKGTRILWLRGLMCFRLAEIPRLRFGASVPCAYGCWPAAGRTHQATADRPHRSIPVEYRSTACDFW